MKRSASSLPTFDSMLIPTIQALQALGGSGTIEEIYEQVVQLLNLPDQVLEISHGSTSQSEVEYRLVWSRTYLKKYGLLENSARGVWSSVSTSIQPDDLDAREIVKAVREVDKKKSIASEPSDALETSDEMAWQLLLLQMLLSLDPNAFERLAQRLLRESGFSQVQVTGKFGDGGLME